MRKLLFSILTVSSFLVADVYGDLSKLEAEQRVLRLKIENYKLQKEVAEYEAYLAKQRASELAKRERDAALLQLKQDLKNRRTLSTVRLYPTSG